MSETLKKLWRGEICPVEERLFDSASEKEIYFEINKIKEKIGNKYKIPEEMFEEISDVYLRLISLLQEEAFASGFSLAVKLILDIK